MTHHPEALRGLASLLRSGLSVRQALLAWPDDVPDLVAGETRAIARRLSLGMGISEALQGTSFDGLIGTGVEIHLRVGIDLAAWLDDRAAALEEHSASFVAAKAASSGAVLSGRMVAGLPLLFVPLTPMAAGTLFDRVGLMLLVTGILLAVAGLRWIGRLIPDPPEEDAIAALCEEISAVLRAGLPLPSAMAVVMRGTRAGLGDAPERAWRLVSLGYTWTEALAAEAELVDVARVITRAQRIGTPAADALIALSRSRRERARREFDRRMRRAPVLMVVPLACCVLPAYGLLGLAPFIRSIGVG